MAGWTQNTLTVVGKMKVGILAIQGSVEEHFSAVEKAGEQAVLVKTPEELAGVDRLIMPGGESTTIGKLLRRFGLRDAIIERVKDGMPIWGTCAGAILLAKKLVGKQTADILELMDVTIERNAYGRQLDSFEGEIEFNGKKIESVFIRAPKIVEVGAGCEILSEHDGEIVAAREGKILITTFHPEMTNDKTVYEYFFEM